MAKPTVKTQAGQLYQTSAEELGKLTSNAGLPAAPISPLGASTVGATPDQAKMTGASAQKTTSLREAIKAGNDLAQRNQQQQQQQTSQSNTAQQAQQYQGLTSFSNRVGNLQQKLAQGPAQAQQAYDTSKAASNPALKNALDQLNKNPKDQATLAFVASTLGMTAADITSGKLADTLSQYGAAAQTTAPRVTLGIMAPEDWKAMGYKDINAFAAAMGVAPAKAATMSVDDAKQLIGSNLQTKFGNADSLRAILRDPFASPADKADARAQLQQMGLSGALSAEEQMKKVGVDVQKAQDITSPSDELVKKNQAALEAQKSLAKTGIQTLADTQAAKAQQANLGDGVTLDESVMKALDPTWGKTSDKVTAQQSVLLRDLQDNKSLSPETKASVSQSLKTLASFGANNKFLQQAAGMKAADFAALVGPNPTTFLNNMRSVQAITNLPSTSSGNEIAQTLGFKDEKELGKSLTDAKIMQTSGLFGEVDPALQTLQGEVVLNANGTINTKATLNALKGKLPSNLKQAGVWTNPAGLKGSLGSYTTSQVQADKVEAKAKSTFSQVVKVPPSNFAVPATDSAIFKKNIMTRQPLMPSSGVAPGGKDWNEMSDNRAKAEADLAVKKSALDKWAEDSKKSLDKYKNSPMYDSLLKQVDKKKEELAGPLRDTEKFLKVQADIYARQSEVYNALGGFTINTTSPSMYSESGTETSARERKGAREWYLSSPKTKPTEEERKIIDEYMNKYGGAK
jgi:hypothetical protein